MARFSKLDPRSMTIEELLPNYGEAHYWKVGACSEEEEQECIERHGIRENRDPHEVRSMTVKTELRKFNQGNVIPRELKRHQGGIHAPGTYGDICTKCGSQRHVRMECPNISERERKTLMTIHIRISIEVEKP